MCLEPRRNPRRHRASLAALLLLLVAAACTPRAPSPPPVVNLLVAGECDARPLQLEVAADPAARARGLMFRRELAPGTGMLFVFPRPARPLFTMRDTPLPLSVAFLDAGGRILNVEEMAPHDETTRYAPAGPALYAVEVPRGWFAEQGIGPGDRCRFDLPPDLIVR